MIDLEGYAQLLGLTPPLVERLQVGARAIEALLSQEIVDCFVSEQEGTGEGSPIYETAWFFVGTNVLELWLSGALRFDCVALDRLIRWDVTARDFAFAGVSDESELSVELAFTSSLGGSLHATGRNCERLEHVLRERIAPSLATP